MRLLFRTLAWLFRALLRTRNDLAMENMALRQQLSVYGQLKVKPRLKTEDRVFWVLFSMGYRSWRTCLRFVQPRTVLRWHAAGFKIFWRKKCEKTGRPRIPKQHQDLIRQMSIDEPGWGADRIADELRLKLGIRHAASTVQKYMVRPEHRTRTGQTWRTLMKNHKDEIWSCDFLVQHTALFSVVYIFIIMEISTRKIIGFNVTCNPTLAWVKQQIREATAFGVQPRILIHDNDGIYGQFGKDRRSHLGYRSHLDYWLKETIGIRGIPITPGCPQETPHIERFNRTLREEALNHFVFFGEAHVHRVVSEYIRFFHGARPHQGLCGIPDPCSDLEFAQHCPSNGSIVRLPVLGGVQGDYRRVA